MIIYDYYVGMLQTFVWMFHEIWDKVRSKFNQTWKPSKKKIENSIQAQLKIQINALQDTF